MYRPNAVFESGGNLRRNQQYSSDVTNNNDVSSSVRIPPSLQNILNPESQDTTATCTFPVQATPPTHWQENVRVAHPPHIPPQMQLVRCAKHSSQEHAFYPGPLSSELAFPLVGALQPDCPNSGVPLVDPVHRQQRVYENASTMIRNETSRRASTMSLDMPDRRTSLSVRPLVDAAHTQQYSRAASNQLNETFSEHTKIERARTHFGIQKAKGQDEYYGYGDGRRTPTQVDGRTINPSWGLTKGNKARKRLAVACLNCRKKKIRCEPTLKSCLQCDRVGVPCCW